MNGIIYDVLINILEYLRHDKGTLSTCSLVSRDFAEVTSRILYESVRYSPNFSRTLDLRRKDVFSEGALYAALLPRHASHVLKFEISGYVSPRPAPLNPLALRLPEAIGYWGNLTTVVLAPTVYDANLFTDVLPRLRECSQLRDLTVNASCTDDIRAPVLSTIEGLETLAIQNPTRAILQLLPEWLDRLSKTLRALYLRGNCGSVTPGVLQSLTPHLTAVEAFGLGLSYSITDSDLFAFLQGVPRLKHLDFRYYLQLRPLPIPLCLPQLQSLTVRYALVETSDSAAYLCKWIRHAANSAPLAYLRLICEEENRGASVRFDGLLAHLAQKHAATLQILRFDSSLVGRDALRQLCVTCVRLQDLAVAVSGNLLTELPEILNPLHDLRTLRIVTRNMKRGQVLMNAEKARQIMLCGPTALRRLAVNGEYWEGQWASKDRREMTFVVEQLDAIRASPWK